jgi:hypothetical protein
MMLRWTGFRRSSTNSKPAPVANSSPSGTPRWSRRNSRSRAGRRLAEFRSLDLLCVALRRDDLRLPGDDGLDSCPKRGPLLSSATMKARIDAVPSDSSRTIRTR